MNRVTGSCLREQIVSRAEMEASFWKMEGIERQAVYKGGCYHDICHYAILKEEYLTHLRNGDYSDFLIRKAKLVQKLRSEFRYYNNV